MDCAPPVVMGLAHTEHRLYDFDVDSLSEHHQWSTSILEAIHSMWLSRQLCDVTIMVKDVPFPAHKLMLASASPYFRAMFTGNVRERESCTVSLLEISPSAFEAILEWIYTRVINLTVSNVEETLVAAAILQLRVVQECAEAFLLSHLTPDNCIGIMRIADLYSCQRLLKASKDFCQLRFCELASSDEFLALQADELVEILKQDTLNVKKEEQVYNAVMAWLAHDVQIRTPEMPAILEHVRLPLVDWSFLKQKVEASKVFQQEECRHFLIEAMQYQARLYHPDLVNFQFNSSSLRAQPRFSFINPEYIYIVGGEAAIEASSSGRQGRDLLSRVDRYHSPSGEWSRLPDLPGKPRRGAGVAVANGVLYVVGGSDGSQSLSAAVALDLHWMRWRDLAPLGTPRSSAAVATGADLLYAFGGNTGYESLSSVERYDPNSNVWSRLQDMSMKRSMAASAYMNGYFYVIGGYDGLHDLADVERYDVKVDQWQTVAPMRFPRSMCCAAVMKGVLFVAGGPAWRSHPPALSDASAEVPRRDQCSLCVCEVDSYDPKSNAWETGRVAPLPFHRRGLGLAVASQRLFAFGGVTNCASLGSAKYHDQLLACEPDLSMPLPPSAHIQPCSAIATAAAGTAPNAAEAVPFRQLTGLLAPEWHCVSALPLAASRFGCCSS